MGARTTLCMLIIVTIVAMAQQALCFAQGDGVLLPVPSRADQLKSLKLIQDLYKSEFATAITRPQRIELARKLIALGVETHEDPGGRFMLLSEALRIAVEARDVTNAFRAIDETARFLRIDAPNVKAATLKKMVVSAKRPIENRNLAFSALSSIDHALESDEYAIAEQLAQVALGAAKKARDGKLVRQIKAKDDAVKEAKNSYRALRGALAILQNRPDDPTANSAAGCYYCFSKQNWDRGIPLLARGSDPMLKSLGQLELKRPASHGDMVAIADAWFHAASRDASTHRTAMLARAAYWYSKALPKLSGLTKQKVERQLQHLERSLGSTAKPSAPPHRLAIPQRVIGVDDHKGEAGRFHVKNVYVLASRQPVLLNETAVYYQARGAAGFETTGTVSFSLDKTTWIPIGKWTPEDMKEAGGQGNWHRVDFASLEKEIRTSRVFVKFEYSAGAQKLVILRAVWSYQGK